MHASRGGPAFHRQPIFCASITIPRALRASPRAREMEARWCLARPPNVSTTSCLPLAAAAPFRCSFARVAFVGLRLDRVVNCRWLRKGPPSPLPSRYCGRDAETERQPRKSRKSAGYRHIATITTIVSPPSTRPQAPRDFVTVDWHGKIDGVGWLMVGIRIPIIWQVLTERTEQQALPGSLVR